MSSRTLRAAGCRRRGPVLRRVVIVRRTAALPPGEPLRRNVRVDERGVQHLAADVENPGIVGYRDGSGRPDRFDDAAAHDDDTRVERPAGRRDDAASRKGEGEAVAAPDFRRSEGADGEKNREDRRHGREQTAPARGCQTFPHGKRGGFYTRHPLWMRKEKA